MLHLIHFSSLFCLSRKRKILHNILSQLPTAPKTSHSKNTGIHMFTSFAEDTDLFVSLFVKFQDKANI